MVLPGMKSTGSIDPIFNDLAWGRAVVVEVFVELGAPFGWLKIINFCLDLRTVLKSPEIQVVD